MSHKKFVFEYKWVVLALSFLLVLFCAGFCCGNRALYLSAITEALGVKRSLYALTDTFYNLSTAIASLFFGALVYRFGSKIVILVGICTTAIAFFISSVSQGLAGFYVGNILLGLGVSFLSTSTASTLIKQYFTDSRGKYTGLVLAANGIGSALSAQVYSPLLNDPADPFSYRTVYRISVCIMLALGVLFFLFLKKQPTAPAQAPKAPGAKREKKNSGLKNTTFLFASATFFAFAMLIQSIYGTYAAYMKDVGMGTAQIVTVASILTLSFAAAKILVGALSDRWGIFPVLTMCQLSFVLALGMLMYLRSAACLPVAILFSVLLAISMPLQTVCLPLITGALFSEDAFEANLGFFSAAACLGAALGSPVINLCYDTLGSYVPVFILWFAVMALIALGYRKLSRKQKQNTHNEVTVR